MYLIMYRSISHVVYITLGDTIVSVQINKIEVSVSNCKLKAFMLCHKKVNTIHQKFIFL